MNQQQVGMQVASSSGGTITRTRTGLIHRSGKAYGGERSELEADTPEGQTVVKRGRGRPRKNP